MTPLSRLLCASSIFFCACASDPEEKRADPGDGPPGEALVVGPEGSKPTSAWPAPFRLDQAVRPLRYDLRLRIDPARPEYSGQVTIPIQVASPRWILRLHADALTLTTVRARVGPSDLAAAAELDGHGNLAIVATDRPFPAGPMVLDIVFEGRMNDAPLGLYRAQEGERWYAYTQLEPLEARRVFPCFDEPGSKVPFGLDLEVPPGQSAVSNMPLSRVESGEGWARHIFDDSPPLPTYLLAFAIGELDFVEHAAVSDGKVPFRTITTHDKGKLVAFTPKKTAAFLAALERWFGSPFPFPKLDQVAVPSFGASGMENPGLITYRESLLLMDADRATGDDRIWAEAVIAHELAHMWFGDLVTMAWWDDIWLNEAFATFMSRWALTEVSPELGTQETQLRSRFGVMLQDARPSARAIRQPIREEGDIYNAFDGITYSKGAAVLGMIEAWLGPEVFRTGVRAYIAERAGASATTDDLVRQLTNASGGLPVERVLRSFADKPGVPVVDVTWSCPPGSAEVAFRLRQRTFRGLGDDRPATGPEASLWSIPVCLAFGGDGPRAQRGEFCGVLERAEETWSQILPECPTWVYPNRNEGGYYRWTVSPRALPVQQPGKLSGPPVEARLVYAEIENVKAEVEAGRGGAERYLDLAAALGREEKELSEVLLGSLLGVGGFIQRAWPEAEHDAEYAKVMRALLKRQRPALDFGGSDASFSARQRNPMLVHVLGRLADKAVLAEALRITEGFLADLEKNTATTALELAAHYVLIHIRNLGTDVGQAGTREALWNRVRAAFGRVRNPTERDLVIEALASFEDPALVVRSYGLLLDGTLRAQDARTLRGATVWREPAARAVWDWVTANFDTLVEKLGQKNAPGLPQYAAALCTEADAQRVASFFDGKKAAIPSGLEHNLQVALEGIRQCARFRALFAEPVKAWVAKRAAALTP